MLATVVVVLLLLTFSSYADIDQKHGAERSFRIGYDENCFLKDGGCFRYVSGSMHYFRVPRDYWQDRMLKMKAAGLNALQTYIEWSSHEPRPGLFDFSGNLDVVAFIKMAADNDLLVILRPGPYIDSERDMGGLPSWLLGQNKSMVLRTVDQTYMLYVERYLSKLLPLLQPLMYSNGGPVISVQVENEYGSYFACDRDYTARLKYLFEKTLGIETLLFTTDGDSESFLRCGAVDGVYATVDFGSGADVKSAFASQRTRQPGGPLVNSEYYPGWIDHWEQPHSLVSAEQVALTLDQMLAMNASVNIYIFHGGTSFGLTSGANYDGTTYMPNPTSYDFDAPLSEAGDITNKFMKIRDVIGKYLPLPPSPIPKNGTKMTFGPIHLKQIFPLLSIIDKLVPFKSPDPLTFEEIGLSQGFVFYETTVKVLTRDPTLLSVPGLRDRGYVFVDRVFRGVLGRGENIFSMPLQIRPGQNLSILVENQGRIAYGTEINDFKGITSNVTLGKNVLSGWTMYALPLDITESILSSDNLHRSRTIHNGSDVSFPAVFEGNFTLPQNKTPADTFLNLEVCKWNKGIAVINGFVLGRYWPIVGPQSTLYVPGRLIEPYPRVNQLILLELENAQCPSGGSGCNVHFVDQPKLDIATPSSITQTWKSQNHFTRTHQ